MVGLILGALVAAGAIFGTPYTRYNCACRDYGWNRSCDSCRSLVYCKYFGVQGWRAVYPEYGEACGWFKMLPFDWKTAARSLSPEKHEVPPYFRGVIEGGGGRQ
jgi:hypothetical protein